jgi:hypothetical protein
MNCIQTSTPTTGGAGRRRLGQRIAQAAAIAALALVASQTAIAQTAPAPSPFQQILPSDGVVKIQQVLWNLSSNNVKKGASDWGQVCINPARLARKFAGDAYISVILYDPLTGGAAWSAANIFVPAAGCDPVPSTVETPTMPMCTYVDLRPYTTGTDGRVPLIYANVVVSSQPALVTNATGYALLQFQPGLFPVGRTVEDTDGFPPDPLIGTFPPRIIDRVEPVGPPPTGLTPAPEPSLDLAYPMCALQSPTPNIQCAQNQCFPMGVSLALQYLENRYDGPILKWNLPHAQVPGIGQTFSAGDVLYWLPVPENSVVAQVDAFTRRGFVASFDSGSGTSSLCQAYDGMFGYLDSTGTPNQANFRHQGTSSLIDQACNLGFPDYGGRSSSSDGNLVTWQWLYDELATGHAIWMGFGRYDNTGARTGGHCVRIYGACLTNGTRYIYTVDDGDQGTNNLGLRTQSWTVVDLHTPGTPNVPNGRLEMGGLMWEIEFAQSIQAIPTP